MIQRRLRYPCWLLALWLASELALAGSCTVVPEGNAKYLVGGKPPASNSPPDCSKLEVLEGRIYVVYENAKGELKSQPCQRGPCLIDSSSSASWRDQVSYASVQGGRRMDKNVTRLAGIPSGRILNPSSATTFNFARAGISQWRLEVFDTAGRHPIYQRSGSEGSIQLPANLLRAGGKYAWQIHAYNEKFSGGFDILSVQEAEPILRQVKEAGRDGSPVGAKLQELIVYYENSLDFEMDLLRQELKI
jgi:hypothetical protein